jgi:hypothetical protein
MDKFLERASNPTINDSIKIIKNASSNSNDTDMSDNRRRSDSSIDNRSDNPRNNPSNNPSQNISLAQAINMYISVFGHPPPAAMVEVLQFKVDKSTADMEEMRVFLVSLKDASSSASAYVKAPTVQDPFYSGLQAAQTSGPDDASRNLNGEVLRNAICNNKTFVDHSDPYKEIRLADVMADRNKAHLLNLCHTDFRKNVPQEQQLNEARLKAGQDGTKWITSSKLVGSPYPEIAAQTSVGTLMPRFVYAEYV